jgi:hypothetical protein
MKLLVGPPQRDILVLAVVREAHIELSALFLLHDFYLLETFSAVYDGRNFCSHSFQWERDLIWDDYYLSGLDFQMD